MGPLGISWSIIIVYIASFIGVPIIIELTLRSKWWKKQSEYYFSFNEKGKKD